MVAEKYICHGCIGDEYISKEIKKRGNTYERCSYCASRKKTIDISALAEEMHKVFTRYYRSRTDGDLYPGYNLGDPAETIIYECLGVDEDISTDIHNILKELYNDYFDGEVYSDDVEYKADLPSSEMFDYKWREIKKSLQGEARFFNQKVKDFFDEIFHKMENLHTVDNQTAINIITPEQNFFRARVFEDHSQVEDALRHPERHFGPPPQLFATPGRMNAQGISVFYGAFSPDIAISEVRPAVGSYVVVAEFNPLNPLRILNISSLDRLRQNKGSYFDPEYVDQLGRTSFLQTLSQKLSIPVSGKKTETEYLITQAVAEYLSIMKDPSIDGVMFKSTQVAIDDKGKQHGDLSQHNIVLFSKSAKVQDAEHTRDRYCINLFEYDYEKNGCGSWLEPTIQLIEQKSKRNFFSQGKSPFNDYSLVLNPDKLVLHEIKGVIIQYTPYPIKRSADMPFKQND